MTEPSDVKTVIDTVKDLNKPQLIALPKIDPRTGAVIAVPSGMTLADAMPFLQPKLERPERRQGTATVTTIASFIEHAKRFKDEHSAIFADDSREKPSLTAVLDYHEQTAAGQPRFGTHRTTYSFPIATEWTFWTAKRDGLAQGEFAALVEDHMLDVVDLALIGEKTREDLVELGIVPASRQRLRELARGLSVHVDSKVTQQINRATGEATLAFQETHQDEAGESVKVPGGFVVGIPVFRGGPRYQLIAKLRYRVRSQAVVWSIELFGADKAFVDAFEEACTKATTDTGLPLFFGRPEA